MSRLDNPPEHDSSLPALPPSQPPTQSHLPAHFPALPAQYNVSDPRSDIFHSPQRAPFPSFSSSGRNALPTPLSPHSNPSAYARQMSPESPLAANSRYASMMSMTDPGPSMRFYGPALSRDNTLPSLAAGMVTPESSPLQPRIASRRMAETPPLIRDSSVMSERTPQGGIQTPRGERSDMHVKLEEPVTPLAPAHIISPPMSVDSIRTHSHLSSPFMGKLSLASASLNMSLREAQREAHMERRPQGGPMHIDDIFSQSVLLPNTISPEPPTPPPIHPALIADPPTQYSQPEMARTYFQRAEEEAAREAAQRELRRPEYLQRLPSTDFLSQTDHSMRPAYDLDPALAAQMTAPSSFYSHRAAPGMGAHPYGGVGLGITESPAKGRRLTLFQETSEESFEESLLAGGYGKYRTIPPELLHTQQQHQPPLHEPEPVADGGALYQRTLDWLQTAQSPVGSAGGSTPAAEPAPRAEEEAPLSPQEQQKRRRLDAFRGAGRAPRDKLCAVEVDGMGRVLLNVPPAELLPAPAAEPTPKKRASRRKRAPRAASPAKPVVPADVEGPDWLDGEFPWCLRARERAEAARAEEEQRLYWIAQFLERSSDDEERVREEPEILPSAAWGELYEEEAPMPVRMGRGKMVPLRANPAGVRRARRGMYFPSDPADARAALSAKRRARALLYRRHRETRGWSVESEGEGEEGGRAVCVCRGRDDGRQMVECDGCGTWYHLECIGLRDVSELGAAEDAWFCGRCARRSASPGPAAMMGPEPMLVPTDDTPTRRRTQDPLFSQANLQVSPATPRRGPGTRAWVTPGAPEEGWGARASAGGLFGTPGKRGAGRQAYGVMPMEEAYRGGVFPARRLWDSPAYAVGARRGSGGGYGVEDSPVVRSGRRGED